MSDLYATIAGVETFDEVLVRFPVTDIIIWPAHPTYYERCAFGDRGQYYSEIEVLNDNARPVVSVALPNLGCSDAISEEGFVKVFCPPAKVVEMLKLHGVFINEDDFSKAVLKNTNIE